MTPYTLFTLFTLRFVLKLKLVLRDCDCEVDDDVCVSPVEIEGVREFADELEFAPAEAFRDEAGA